MSNVKNVNSQASIIVGSKTNNTINNKNSNSSVGSNISNVGSNNNNSSNNNSSNNNSNNNSSSVGSNTKISGNIGYVMNNNVVNNKNDNKTPIVSCWNKNLHCVEGNKCINCGPKQESKSSSLVHYPPLRADNGKSFMNNLVVKENAENVQSESDEDNDEDEEKQVSKPVYVRNNWKPKLCFKGIRCRQRNLCQYCHPGDQNWPRQVCFRNKYCLKIDCKYAHPCGKNYNAQIAKNTEMLEQILRGLQQLRLVPIPVQGNNMPFPQPQQQFYGPQQQ